MTFNFLGPGLTVNVEAKVKEQIILDSSVPRYMYQSTYSTFLNFPRLCASDQTIHGFKTKFPLNPFGVKR